MNINVYLPDELGQRVKQEFKRGMVSRLLRAAVQEEFARREESERYAEDVARVLAAQCGVSGK